MTRQEYRAHPALNFSRAKHLLDSPAHFQHALRNPVKSTEDMQMGTWLHEAWLENKTQQFALKPDGMSFATKEGKAWRDANEGNPIISAADMTRFSSMVCALRDCPIAMQLLDAMMHREDALFFRSHGVECKALPDAWGRDSSGWPCMLDLKKCQDASPDKWAKDAANRHYDMQAAWYKAALKNLICDSREPHFFWVCVEDSPTTPVQVYELPPEAIESGERKMALALTRYRECMASGKWPGYSDGETIQQLNWPQWA